MGNTKIVFLLILAFAIENGNSVLEDDGYLDTVQLAKKYGYSCEKHSATTDDGYILGLHRITGRLGGPKVQNSAPTVLIMHGIFSASTLFILSGTNSLAGILSDAGIDVWLGNIRGNRYSRKHLTLDPNESKFWNHTYNEIVLKDYPTIVDYILNTVGKNSLHYVGYSQGGALSAAFLGIKTEYNAKIKSLTILGSTYYLRKNFKTLQSPVFRSIFIKMLPDSYKEDVIFNPYESFPYAQQNVRIAYKYCNKDSPFIKYCRQFTDEFFGKDTLITPDLYTYSAAHVMNGQSSNLVLHLSQMFNDGVLRLFDYKENNYKFYNKDTPPVADIKKITPPKLFIYGSQDPIFSEPEVTGSSNYFTSGVKVIRLEGYNHMNFMMATNLKTKVADPLIEHVRSNN